VNEWNNYMYQFYQIQQQHDQRIRELEEKISDLKQQIQENKSSSIDKIEYHFDQLKIERLDGTLHIGLSPNELSNIDNLGIPIPEQAKTINPVNQKFIPPLHQFINERGPQMIQELSEKHRKPIDKQLERNMIHDMLGQIPDRVKFYEKEAFEKHQITEEQQLESYISDHVKKEIYHSLQRFMENKEDQKGESS
jgi:spore germination protein PC